MVMPCSRSARRPSVSRARLVCSAPIASLDRSTASNWSSKIALESNSSRPMSVDFPSSTDPAVANRKMSILEVTFLLAIFLGGRAGPVRGAGRAALGDPGGRDLHDDLLDRGGGRLHGA